MVFDPRIDLPPLPSSRETALNEEISEADNEHTISALSNETSTNLPQEDEKDSASQITTTANKEQFLKEEEEEKALEEEERMKEKEAERIQEEKLFATHEPLPPSTTSSVINQYLSSTSRFVNAFVASADARLDSSSDKISALDIQIGLLESKLSSIPGLDDGGADLDEKVYV
uniref:Uncharacterized protein n=1 Tax=Ditylum brightwellii TaxID=49249 RepID=A0A7S2E7E0_9STRA